MARLVSRKDARTLGAGIAGCKSQIQTGNGGSRSGSALDVVRGDTEGWGMDATSLVRELALTPPTGSRMPALFIGHGSPMNAIEETEFSRAWAEMARRLPRPRAILCVSAHWETRGTRVTAMPQPRTIHDFHGFPPELHARQYPAPGSPETARLTRETVRQTEVELDTDWGLDHGAWAVLARMYPRADVPVVQLSLDRGKGPEAHYALGRELQSLRERGVLIVGSGNIVHNLRRMVWEEEAFDWALEFDAAVRERLLDRDHEALIRTERLGRAGPLAVPTPEHFLPLLYVAATGRADEALEFFTERVTFGSISMRCAAFGLAPANPEARWV